MDRLRHAAGLQKPIAADRHGHGENVVRVEARINRLQLHKRANEQRRSDDEYKRKSHLTDHQNGTRLAAAKAHSYTVAALVQNGRKILM